MLRLTDFIIDCPVTLELAGFYGALTGLPVKEGSDDFWAGIDLGAVELAFIRVDDFRPPQWPDEAHPKQFHLDFEVDDIEAEERRALALGASRLRDCIGADGYGFRVYADPVGHPFCLCRNRGVTWSERGPEWPAAAHILSTGPLGEGFSTGAAESVSDVGGEP